MPRAGDLNQRVTLQSATEAPDAVGQSVKTWTTVSKLWARITPVGGGESVSGKQVVADASHAVTIRHRDDVTPRMRLLWGSRVLEIAAVDDPDGLRTDLVLSCREAK